MKEKIAVVLALAGLASPMIAKDANAEEQESRVDDIKLVDNAKSGDTLKCKINGDNVDNNDITYTWLKSDDSENWVETEVTESEYSVSDEKYIKVRIEYNGKSFESNVVRVDNGIIGLSQAGIENRLDSAVVTESSATLMTLARASRLASNVNSYVPELEVYQEGSHPRVQINIDMDEHDVIGSIDFSKSNQYDLNPRGTGNGNQSIQNDNGKYYYHLTDTITNKNGNDHDRDEVLPTTYSKIMYPNTAFKPKNGQWLSFSYNIKSKGYGWVNSVVETEKQVYKTEDVKDYSGHRIFFNDDVDFTTVPKEVPVTFENGICDYPDNFSFVVCTKVQAPYTEVLYRVDKANSKLVWVGWWSGNTPRGSHQVFHKGDTVQTRHWGEGNVVKYFNGDQDWHKVSNNFIATDSIDYYDMSKDGVHFFQSNGTDGEINISDLKFGYASRAQVQRKSDNKIVYDGYDSKYEDTEITTADVKTPIVTGTSTNKNATFKFKAEDNEKKEYYQSRSINRAGVASSWSDWQEVDMGSHIKGYAVKVDNSPTGDPGKTINNTTGQITVDGSKVNVKLPIYAHVRAIDTNGKVSDVVNSVKQEIIDTDIANSYVPELEVFQEGNHPKVEINIDMDEHDVIWQTGFESGENKPNLRWQPFDGNQSFVSENGNTVERLVNNRTNLEGNFFSYPDTKSPNSYSSFQQPITSTNERWFSAVANVKASGGSYNSFAFRGISGHESGGKQMTDDEGKLVKYKNSASWENSTPREVEVYSDGGTVKFNDGATYVLVSSTSRNYDWGLSYFIWHQAEQKFVFDPGGGDRYVNKRPAAPQAQLNAQVFSAGDPVICYPGNADLYFTERQIQNDNQWHRISQNANLWESVENYDYSKYGFFPAYYWSTNGEMKLDNIKFGYASKVKLYRDGQLVNAGTYQSDYVDNDITVKPNAVKQEDISADTEDDTVNFNFKAENNSERHTYQAQSISNYNGRESVLSPETEVTIESKVKGYAVKVDNNPTSDPGTTINNTTGKVSTDDYHDLDLSSPIYIHIRTIDQNGQASDIVNKEAPQTASQFMKQIQDAEEGRSTASNASAVKIPDVISYAALADDGEGIKIYQNAMNDTGDNNVKKNDALKDVVVTVDTNATEFSTDPNATVKISYNAPTSSNNKAKQKKSQSFLSRMMGTVEAYADNADNSTQSKIRTVVIKRTVSPSISAQTLNEAKLVTDKYLSSYSPDTKVLKKGVSDAEKIEEIKKSVKESLDQVVNIDKYSYTIDNINFTSPTDKTKGNLSFSINITDGTETVTSEYAVKILDQLPQTLDTVKNLYTEATNKFVPSNDTTEDDLLSLVQITNVDISAEVSEFKLVPSVDTREGRLTAIVKLKDSETGETANVPVAVDVPIASTELATAVKNVQAYRDSLTMTNDTQTLDIIRGAQSSIHNSNILVSWSIDGDEAVKRKDATEDDEGYFKGCLIVSDSENEVKVPFSYTIAKLPQTVDSAMEKAKKVLQDNSYADTTTESDVFNIVLNTLHDYNIADLDIKIIDFGVEAATEESEGNLKGILNITKGDESATFDLSELKIKQAAQTYATLEKALKGTQNKIYTNSTSKSEVQEMLNSYVTGAEGSIFKITIDDDDFKVTKATEDSAGKINVVATVTDNNADIHKINLQYKINQLPQTVDGAYEKALEIWNNYNNKTATIDKDDLTEKLQAAITHIEGSDITITVNDFEVTPPTELAEGSIEGSINISDLDENSKTILINEKLNRLPITDETVKTQIEEALKKIKPTNDSTKESIIEQIFTESGLPKDTVTIDIDNFKVSKSTGREEGKVTGTIIANDNSIPLDLTIAKITQDNNITKVALDSYIEEYQKYIIEHNTVSMDDIANNKELDIVDVTEESSLDYLTDKINNANASLKWEECDVTSPTEDKEGKLEGILVLADAVSGNEIQKYNVKITIPKAPPILKYSEKVFKDELEKSNFTNKSSESDIVQILGKLPENVRTNLSKFSITKATSRKAGSIRFTVSYEHDSERNKLNYTVSIPRVGSHDTSSVVVSDVTQAEEEAKSSFQEVVDKINKLLDEHKYTSDSDWSTIDSIVKDNLNEGYKYKIAKYDRTGSTIDSNGKIDYTISIINNQFVATTEHSIVLPKLNSTEDSSSTSQPPTITPIDEVKDTNIITTSNLKDIFNSLDAKLKSYSYNKNTSTKDILNTIIKTVGNKCSYTLDTFTKKVDESKQTVINFKTSLWDKVSKISSTYNVTIPESGETHVDSTVDSIRPATKEDGISNKDNGFAKGELDVTKAEDNINKQIEKDKPDSYDKITASIEKRLPTGFSYDILNYKKLNPTETTDGSIEFDLKLWNEYVTSTTHYKIIISKLGSHTPIKISHDETGMNGGAPTIKGESQKIYNMHKKIKDDISKSNISNSTQYADIENIIKADVTEGYNYTIFDYRLVADKNIDFNLKIGNDTTAVTMHYIVNIKDKSCTIDMISIDNDNTKYGESDTSNIPKNPEKPTNSGSSGSHSSGGHSSGGHSTNSSSSDDSEDDSDIGSSGYSHSNSDIGDSSSSNSNEDKDNNNSLDDDSVDYANDVEEDDILTITTNNSKRNINVNKDTTSDNVNAIKIITKDYKWNEDKSNSGTVSLLYDENKSLEGVRLKTSNAYASGNIVTIDTGTKNVNKITGLYYYNKEVGAYVDTGEAISYNGTKVTFSTTGEIMYLLARDNTNINIVKNGWIKTNGKYQYIENSKLVKNTWKQINNKWYRFDNKGFMMTGWQGQDGYIKDTGELATGWTLINGKWYYFEDSGKPKQGWVSTNGKWYYMNTAGEMQTGWVQDQGTWYYMNSDGSMATGWIETGGNWYYLDQSGHMLYNTTVDGYVLDGSGKWIQ